MFNPDAEWNNYLNPLFLSRGTGSKTSKPEKETIVLFQELVFYFLVMNIFVYLQITYLYIYKFRKKNICKITIKLLSCLSKLGLKTMKKAKEVMSTKINVSVVIRKGHTGFGDEQVIVCFPARVDLANAFHI